MYGAFLNDELAGFIGIHSADSIGMLRVFEQYRGRHIGRAMQTFIINKMLEMGYIPYGQFLIGDEGSERLQKSLGMYMSKTPVIWVD